MPNSEINALCSQLLTANDLKISKELFLKLQNDDIVTSIFENNDLRSIKIFSKTKLYLTQITPILHDMGFVIIDEVTYEIIQDKIKVYVSRFNLSLEDTKKIQKASENIEYVLSQTLKSDVIKNCKLYTLVYDENFSIKKIFLLRALIEYLDQAALNLNSVTISNTLKKHHKISSLFVNYFMSKFNPMIKNRKTLLSSITTEIEDSIKLIPDIIDDRILKIMFELLKSLLRTNFYLNKEAISFKINTKEFSQNLKGLQPNLESFVYHPDFYGVHLRMSKISRGGLRWSERHDDYRQEIKSLMITQESKNSIIIPDGAKGGFVINKESSEITKEFFTKIYSLYINSMLDLVDNMEDSKVIKNKNIIAYDDDDAYFVVAADKGTAAMSDIANDIAKSRNFWLGDAFASGGSNGYGHKDLGITAKGSIESTKRFFLEEGIDIYKDEISVIGLGSMNGDVFGNGMIESDKFKLIAAIAHKEIFIDPNPDLKTAYIERKRLFNEKDSSWKKYNNKLISKGGGIFSRKDKEILLSSEIKTLLNTNKKVLSGEELAKKLLCLDVDLLFNAGVGTYVKASEENSLDIGDKQNEALRIDAQELKARIVCEGGNLGFTQKARIEFALNGGKINLDAIDNAAGVNTSDREVNLKILLNIIKNDGLLTQEEANTSLHSLTSQVVEMVLDNNYKQALAISIDERFSRRYLSDFLRSIEVLENNLLAFKRSNLNIPKNESIKNIIDKNASIVRPVLGSLLSSCKILVKNILMESTLIDETFALKFLYSYFPKTYASSYKNEINKHPLKREIIATCIADFLINSQGVTFVGDYDKLGAFKFINKIKSFIIVNDLFDSVKIKDLIALNDYKIDIKTQYKLINKLEYIIYASTRWMVKYLKQNQLDINHILDHKKELFLLLSSVHKQNLIVYLEGEDKFNEFFSVIDYLRFAVAAINVKENSNHSFKDVVVLFYCLIHEFNILDIIVALNRVDILNKSDMTLRTQVLQFVEFIVVNYTKKILDFKRVNEEPELAFSNFINNDKETFLKVKNNLNRFMKNDNKDIKDITITVNQLMVSLI